MGLGSRKQRAGFSSRQGVYDPLVPRPPSPAYGTKCPIPLDTVTICVATLIYFRGRSFLKIEMGGKAILGLSRLDYPSAKTGETVNGGAKSAVHLDR